MPNYKFEGGVTAAYNVSDVKSSIDWYQDILGFKVQYHLEEMGWCEMETHIPKVNVGLSQVENPEVKGGPTLTWGVIDIDAARAELESKGVKFDGETTEIPDMVKLATFFDPDGNHLMMYQGLGVTA